MKSSGYSLLTILTIIFIVLKLLGLISWSWWLVLCPLWIPVACFLFMIMIIYIASFIFTKK